MATIQHHQLILQMILLLISVAAQSKDGSVDAVDGNQKDYEAEVRQHFIQAPVSADSDGDSFLSVILQPDEVNYSDKARKIEILPSTIHEERSSILNDEYDKTQNSSVSTGITDQTASPTASEENSTITTQSSEESQEYSDEYDDDRPPMSTILGTNVRYTLSVEDERYMKTSNENDDANATRKQWSTVVTKTATITSDSISNNPNIKDALKLTQTSILPIKTLENDNETPHKSINELQTESVQENRPLHTAILSTDPPPPSSSTTAETTTTSPPASSSSTSASSITTTITTKPITVEITSATTTTSSPHDVTTLSSTPTLSEATSQLSDASPQLSLDFSTPKEAMFSPSSSPSTTEEKVSPYLFSSSNYESNTLFNIHVSSAQTEPSVFRPTIRSRLARPKMISNLKTRHSTTTTAAATTTTTTSTQTSLASLPIFSAESSTRIETTTPLAILKETVAPPVMTLLKDFNLDYQLNDNPPDLTILFKDSDQTMEQPASTISATTTNTIVISSVIGGCAILFFAILMFFYMWKQRTVRRRRKRHPELGSSKAPFHWHFADNYAADYE